jgi:hypothetical protein
MKTIYAVQQYTFEDWNVVQWFDEAEQANALHTELSIKNPAYACYYKVKAIANDAMGNNFRFFNISQNNKG